MAGKAPVTDETMYAVWVANARNATKAAKVVGMNGATFRHHVRTKQFDKRYAASIEGDAMDSARISIYSAMSRMSELYDALFDIALGKVTTKVVDRHGELAEVPPTFRERTAAADSILKALPRLGVTETLSQPPAQSLTVTESRLAIEPANIVSLDAQFVAVSPSDTEDEIENTARPSHAPLSTPDAPDDTDVEAELRRILDARMSQ